MKNIVLLISLLFLHLSCTKELRYSKEALFAKAKRADPSVTFILPKSINDGVNCKDYSEGCQSGHIVQVRGLEMIAVEFLNEEQARNGAIKVRGYYIRNWLLDDVTGEPTLENFVVDVLKAKKPEENTLKKP